MNKYPWKNGDVLILDNYWIFIYCGYSHVEILNQDVFVYHCLSTLSTIDDSFGDYYFSAYKGVGIGSINEKFVKRARNNEINKFWKLMERNKIHWDAEEKCMKHFDGSPCGERMPAGWDIIIEE